MSNHSKRLHLTSPAFGDGGLIPEQYTADGRNESPPFQWGEPPEGTQSFALICEDPDAPRGTFTHWVLFNIPADARILHGGIDSQATLPDGSRQGGNDFGRIGYGGPAPPPGPQHRYLFKLYALDTKLGLEAGATKEQLLEAMRGHILDRGELVGLYGRKAK